MNYDRTDLEQIMANVLEDRGIEFVEQYPTDSGFVLDFVIAPDICFEVDGPCHDSSKSRKRDWLRSRCLLLEGWKIYRFSYKTMRDSDIFDKKLNAILGDRKA